MITEPPPPISVVLADHHPLLLERAAEIVGARDRLALACTAADGPAALAAIRAAAPQVAVLDWDLPGLSALAILRAIETERRATRVVVVAGRLDCSIGYEALAAGAAGALGTDLTGEQLCAAIEAAAAGRIHLAGGVWESVAREIRARERNERPLFTPRELEVLNRMAAGQSGPVMSRAMHVSLTTVKTHMSRIYAKLEVSERGAAVAAAFRLGVLS